MKSKEFITEAEYQDQGWDDMHDAAEVRALERMQQELIPSLDLIKRECQPFLQQWGQQPLIRGVKRGATNFIKKEVHLEDRVPKDTPRRLHTQFNKAFVNEFGLPFRNAMFASGDHAIAKDYGLPYTVFPIGDFKFIWSKEVDDLYGQWQRVEPHRQHDDPESDEYWEWRLSRAEKRFTEQSVKKYQTTELNKAISSRHEIMLWVDSYYGINVEIFEDNYEFIMDYLK